MSVSSELINALDIGPNLLSGPLEFGEAVVGAVVSGCLVTMSQGVSEQHRQDVLQSLLLAQLAANTKADRFKDPGSWYKAYQVTMEQVGWVIESSSTMIRYRPPGTRFTVPMVVNDLFKQRVLPEELSIIAKTFNALRQEAGETGQFIFECPSHAGGIGNFQFVLVTEEDGIVYMRLGRFSFTAKEHVIRLLLEEFPTDAQFLYGFTSMSLNEQTYALVRDMVARKLEGRFVGSVALVTLAAE